MEPAVFLDRDNTLIRNDGDLGDPEAVELFQGAASAIASLCGLGFKVIVVTNQGGVARGKYTEEDVDRVHDRIRQMVAAQCTGARIDAFYFCPYHPQATVMRYKKEHPWRKPQPGMLLQAAQDLGLDLRRSWMIGDQMRDIEAGDAAGVRTILLRADADRLQPLDVAGVATVKRDAEDEGDHVVKPRYLARSLVEAVRIVAQKRNALDEPDAPPPDVAAGPGSAGTPAARKWDAAAVARLQRRAEKEPERPASEQVPRPPGTGKPVRPFRPLTAPPAEVEKDEDDAPPRRRPRQERRETVDADTGTADVGATTHALPEAQGADDGGSTDAPLTTHPSPLTTTTTAADAPAEGAPMQAERGSSAQLAVLRQILQELRNQREVHGQFSSTSIIVLVMLIVAVVCYVAALMMGGSDPGLFYKLFATTVVILLGCIVGLLLRK